VAPSGVLVRAYQQAKSIELFMPISESEIEKAGLSRGEASLKKLAESLDLREQGGQTFLESSLPGVLKPKVVPSGEGVRQYIGRTKAGDETFPEFLTTALSELCKAKPAGLEAVRWLGNWLLENNPNKPKVEEPVVSEEERPPLDADEAVVVQSLEKFQVVFVLGGPGAGKGTQCARISQKFGYAHLSAGDLLRAERKDPTSEHGELINGFIREGKIVPVEITLQLLKKAMVGSGQRHFLIDGFPRNLDNFQGWNDHMADCADVQFLLYLHTSEAVMQERILQRAAAAASAGQPVRADDNPESIQKRFKTYLDSTVPIIDHFKAIGKCHTVDSSPSPDLVFADISKLFAPATA